MQRNFVRAIGTGLTSRSSPTGPARPLSAAPPPPPPPPLPPAATGPEAGTGVKLGVWAPRDPVGKAMAESASSDVTARSMAHEKEVKERMFLLRDGEEKSVIL